MSGGKSHLSEDSSLFLAITTWIFLNYARSVSPQRYLMNVLVKSYMFYLETRTLCFKKSLSVSCLNSSHCILASSLSTSSVWEGNGFDWKWETFCKVFQLHRSSFFSVQQDFFLISTSLHTTVYFFAHVHVHVNDVQTVPSKTKWT